MKDNTRFLVNLFQEENLPYPFEKINSQFVRDGFLKINDDQGEVKVYEPRLLYFLSLNALEAINMDTKAVVELSMNEYTKTYIAGFREGKKQFKQDYNSLYEEYVKDINFYFFEPKKELSGLSIWEKVKQPFTHIIITHKLIHSYGFNAGMLSSLEGEMLKHPNLFNPPSNHIRLTSKYNEQCIFEIGNYLIDAKKLNGNIDDWLFWWNKKDIETKPMPMKFANKTLCVDVIIRLHGKANKKAMEAAFGIKEATRSNKKQPFNTSQHGKEITKIIQKYPK